MKSVVICGSRKFKQEINKFADELEELGVLVYAPDVDADHIQKMRMADVVFVYNKDGYAGVSVTLEIGAAIALAKPIYALADDPEVCRQVLFQAVISSPEELVKKLS